jgi:hypothetical protein
VSPSSYTRAVLFIGLTTRSQFLVGGVERLIWRLHVDSRIDPRPCRFDLAFNFHWRLAWRVDSGVLVGFGGYRFRGIFSLLT